MILVTGGAGFIGSHLCHRLFFDGYDVISLDDYSTGSESNHVRGVDYRRGHTSEIAKLVPERPDVIFHLGEYSRVEASFDDRERVEQSNIVGTAGVRLFWVERTDARLVYAASSTAFATCGTTSPYAAAKQLNVRETSEWIDSGRHASICYFYNVYGPGERPASESGTVIETFRRQRLAGEPLTVVAPGDQRRNFTDVRDIVDGLMLAMHHDGQFQIGAGESYSVLEVAQMFGGPIEMLPPRPGNRMDSTIDRASIHALGWRQKHKLADYIATITGAKAAA